MLHCQCQHLLLLLLLLFTWIGYIHTLDPSCLLLSGSQECQAFQDYAVNVSNAAPWIRNSTSVNDVDKHLRRYVKLRQWWWQSNITNTPNNSSMIDPLCGLNGGMFSARYSKTVLCAQMVRTSPGCNNSNSTSFLLPSLCNATCAGFVNSIASCYTSNATLLYQQCPSSTDEATCVNGYDNEELCGWTGDDGEGCTYCQAKPNDPCCATLYEDGTCSSLNTQQLVSVILGSVFGCLFLLASIWYYCWWDQRYKHYSPPWPFSSSFFSRKKFRSSSSSSSQYQHNNNDSDHLTQYSPYNDSTAGSNSSSNNLIPRQIPTKNHTSGMDRTIGKNTTDDTNNTNDMEHMDNMIGMNSTVGTSTSITKEDDQHPMTLSYTLVKRHATGYCFYQAIYVNVPSRPDDIVLEKGDIVYLHCYTNEDWGIGYNISTGQQGSFPMICICSLPLNQVWEWVHAHPIVKLRSLLKHRVSYFISSAQQDDEDAEADDEHDTTTVETTKKAVSRIKTKRTGSEISATATITTTAMMSRMTLSPSSDDEDSPLTPPPPTLLHRALGKKNKALSRSKRWSGGGSSLQQQQQQQQQQRQQQLYYQPLGSTLTLGYPTPLD